MLLTFFTFIGYLYLSFLKSFESFFEIQIINIIFNFFKLLIVFISILFSFDMFFIISFIALFKFIQTFLYFYILKAHFHLKFYFIKLRFKEIKIWTSYSSILFLSSLVGFCFNIFDKVIIAAKLGLANIGLYDAASKPKDGLKSVLGVLYSAIDPLTVKVFHLKGKSNVSQLFFDVSFFIIIIFIPFFIFIISNMDMLINIWLGDNVNNIEIINYAIILSITLLINLHSSVANTMLVALREAKSLLPFQIISAIIVIFVTILFIDKLGIYACIIALICGNLFSSFFTLLKLKLFLNISSNVLFYKLISFLLFLIITFCFTFLLKSIVPVTFFKSDILYLFLQFAILFVIVLAIFNIQIKKTYENFKRYYEK